MTVTDPTTTAPTAAATERWLTGLEVAWELVDPLDLNKVDAKASLRNQARDIPIDDELVDAASPLVPPGRAAREAERCRVAQQLDRTGTTTPRIFDRGDPHASGARRLVVSSLWGLSRRAVIEHDQPRALYRLARSAR